MLIIIDPKTLKVNNEFGNSSGLQQQNLFPDPIAGHFTEPFFVEPILKIGLLDLFSMELTFCYHEMLKF